MHNRELENDGIRGLASSGRVSGEVTLNTDVNKVRGSPVKIWGKAILGSRCKSPEAGTWCT